jgi:membrane-associated protein
VLARSISSAPLAAKLAGLESSDALLYVFLATLSTIAIPLPEEATLLAAGYVARFGRAPLVGCIAAAWLAVMIGDTLGYWFGRSLLARLLRTALGRRLFPEARRMWAERVVREHGGRAVVLARFFVGLRGFLYFAIGASRYSFGRFLAVNAAAGAVEIGALAGLGFALGDLHFRPDGGQRLGVAVDLLAAAALLATFVVQALVRARPRN